MSQVELTNGEAEHLIIEGTKLYLLIGACLLTFGVLTYGATTARSEVQKVNSKLELQKASSGAKIETLINNITSDKKELQEIVVKAEKLNVNIEKNEKALEKYNIILTK